MDISILTPMYACSISCDSLSLTSFKLSPTTEIAPSSGNNIVPSSLTFKLNMASFEPDKITVN